MRRLVPLLLVLAATGSEKCELPDRTKGGLPTYRNEVGSPLHYLPRVTRLGGANNRQNLPVLQHDTGCVASSEGCHIQIIDLILP